MRRGTFYRTWGKVINFDPMFRYKINNVELLPPGEYSVTLASMDYAKVENVIVATFNFNDCIRKDI